MFDRKFYVTMEGQIMAEGMTLETALVLIKALAQEYWREMQEQGKITLLEMARVEAPYENKEVKKWAD